MKRLVGFLMLVLLGLAVPLVGQGQGRVDGKSPMQRKLLHSQKVLEGLALNDFEAIARHANELILISKLAEWKVFQTPRYELFTNDFRRSAEELVGQAKDKNIDGATLAYLDMTLTCVKCHRYVRETRQVRLE